MNVSVQCIGDADRAEMRPIVTWLKNRTTAESLHHNTSIVDYLGHRLPEWQPDLIVVLETHPDEYSSDDVTALFAATPISRIVCCAGAWSESAGRTRKLWPLAVRVAAVSAIPRLEREYRLLSNESAEAPLPPTGSREEWFASHHPAIPQTVNMPTKKVGVMSPDPAYRDMLADLLTASGCTVSVNDDDAIDVLLWDVDPWSPTQSAELPRRRTTAPPSAVIALSNWVTPDLVAELVRAGVLAVLPKLGDHGRLCECIQSAVRR